MMCKKLFFTCRLLQFLHIRIFIKSRVQQYNLSSSSSKRKIFQYFYRLLVHIILVCIFRKKSLFSFLMCLLKKVVETCFNVFCGIDSTNSILFLLILKWPDFPFSRLFVWAVRKHSPMFEKNDHKNERYLCLVIHIFTEYMSN